MEENKNLNNQPEKEEKKKKECGFLVWWHNLGNAGRIAICCLAGAAVAAAVTIPTVIVINKNKDSGDKKTDPKISFDTETASLLKSTTFEKKDGNFVGILNAKDSTKKVKLVEVKKGETKLTKDNHYTYAEDSQTLTIIGNKVNDINGDIVIKAVVEEALESCKIDWDTRKIESTHTLRDLAFECAKLVIGTNQKYKETAEALDELVTYNVEEGESPTGIIKAYYGKNQNSKLELYVLSDKRIAFDDNDRISGGNYGFFYYLNNLKSIILENIDTSNVEDFSDTFGACAQNLSEIDVSQFNTSKAKNMKNMFHSFFYFPPTIPLTIKGLANFDTSKVTNMDSMFYYCKCSSLDLSNFDTSNVTSMKQMFYGCSDLQTIYASDKFVTTSITETGESLSTDMFKSCTQLVGGQGTSCDGTSHINKEYARIDGGASNPGYFSVKA